MTSVSKRYLFRSSRPQLSLFTPSSTATQLFEDDLAFAERFCSNDEEAELLLEEDDIQEEPEPDPSDPQLQKLLHLVDETIELLSRKASHLSVERKVRQLYDLYVDLDSHHRGQALIYLAQHHDIHLDSVISSSKTVAQLDHLDDSQEPLEKLRSSLTPAYQQLFIKIGQLEEGVKFLVDVRASILTMINPNQNCSPGIRSALSAMNWQLQKLLVNWFSLGFLTIEQVTWSSSSHILQKVLDYESVHPMQNWSDLKSRVGPYRRCFIYTHRSMPGEPIVLLHVALTTEIVSKISNIVRHHVRMKRRYSMDESLTSVCGSRSSCPGSGSEESGEAAECCTTGLFYSITSSQVGLQGIELGNLLIKQAIHKLKQEFPEMHQFCTLSPVPGFCQWMLKALDQAKSGQRQLFSPEDIAAWTSSDQMSADEFYDELSDRIKHHSWIRDSKMVSLLEAPIMRLCARYLLCEKRPLSGLALDPVANFHLRNGAVIWRINWMADLSAKGLRLSSGIMVNYRYLLDDMEHNSTNYLEAKAIAAGEQVTLLAGSHHSPAP